MMCCDMLLMDRLAVWPCNTSKAADDRGVSGWWSTHSHRTVRWVFAGVRPDDLAALVMGEIVSRTGVDPDSIDQVIFGAANQSGEDDRNVARIALDHPAPARDQP
jgi:acetyl-CoA acetyltransferase